MKQALVIRHVPFEDLGSFAAPIAEAGYEVTYIEAGRDRLSPQAAGAELVIILGGPIGVYQVEDYPFLREEIDLARMRLAQDAPTLGICLGCQIMAAASNADVFPGTAGKEIGWAPITLTEHGARSALAELVEPDAEVMHWHGDSWSLPSGTLHLASSSRYANQAFSVGQRGLGLQFHAEIEQDGMERWYIGHAVEIATTPDVCIARLRTETAVRASALRKRGQRFIARWLKDITI